MRCEILRTLYVKANGEIPCHDDLGERIGLGWVPESGELDLAGLLDGERYRHLRTELAAGRPPWPGTCEGCAFLRPDEPFEDGFATGRLSKIQVEPTLACALGCPGCSRVVQFRERPGSRRLDLDRYERLLRAVASGGYEVEFLEYCGQGEPLDHPEFAAFVAAGRRWLPGARQRLITNGNHSYAETVGDARLDEIIVSVDGATQASYDQYRIRGSLERALGFLADAARSSGTGTQLIWKYILFAHNDSDDELRSAGTMARDLGVDTLLFVVTHSAGRSERFTIDNLAEVLLAAPGARVGTTPILERGNAVGTLAGPLRWRRDGGRLQRRGGVEPTVLLDEVRLLADRVASVRGWAASGGGRPVEVRGQIGGREAVSVSGLRRPDVPAARTDVSSDQVGFACSCRWPEGSTRPTPMRFVVEADEGAWHADTTISWSASSG